MTGNAFGELRDAELVSALGIDKATQLVHMDPSVKLDSAPGLDLSGLSPGLLRNLVGSDGRIEFPPYYLEGSNNWTVSGCLTATGTPLLADDPHRVLAIPSLRYRIRLERHALRMGLLSYNRSRNMTLLRAATESAISDIKRSWPLW